MHSFATLTAITATLASLTSAVPLAHAPKHARLHAPRAIDMHSKPEIVKLAPVLNVREVPTVRLDVYGGTCGGTTGNGCAEGFCCSKWGYCGQGPAYCGDAPVLNGTAPSAAGETHAVSIAANGLGRHDWGPSRPWANAPPATSSTGNGLPSSAPAPETYAAPAPVAPSEAPAPAPSSSKAPQPSSAAPAPSSSTPQSSSSPDPAGEGMGDVYRMYNGNGAPSSGWPSQDQWASFEDSWAANEPLIKISCSQFGQEDPSDEEVADVKSAIESVASESGVDSRFILAIMMQESKGCVRAPTTAWSHENPGLFQSFQGTGTCNPDGTGVVPCPASSITQMVKDGVQGTASGPGLQQNLARRAGSSSDSQQYYEAARIYNAGSIPADENLGAVGATPCYCSDVANRLTGWASSDSACTLG